MFEITGKDISELNDSDLRTLIARLAIAELRANSQPISAVTAGGNQDAGDGGIDVRVTMTGDGIDFVPRPFTGFQSKASDMSSAAIEHEMRPRGILRSSIAELAAKGGAYIIVSSKGSVADKPLRERKSAMRKALDGHPDADKLAVDFYDRGRIATWVNEYPGTVAWVRQRTGNHIVGWQHIGDWTDTKVDEETGFLTDDKACLIDERTKECEKVTIAEGISRLRDSLTTPRQCVRLIGLSGVGKTRLVQSLFESEIGNNPLDPSLALYTDYSEEPTPIAREMARHLVDSGTKAILVIDNCNPATHADLARICSTKKSNVSLITVEYDVGGDETERTEVFRLMSASPSLVSDWIDRIFPHVSRNDRDRIAEFSDGNFRIARALAETLQKGETLGQLKDRELFLRIFRQRNEPDKELQYAAEDLSLLYSFDGMDSSEGGELAILASIRNVAPLELFTSVVALGHRGIVQSRGRWRAILPQAIANRLASLALERIPSADFDRICSAISPRMLKSLTRRLGYLHNSKEARSTVTRWLQPGALFGDFNSLDEGGLKLLENIAPVAPELILAKLKASITGANEASILRGDFFCGSRWINLVRALAYEAHLFQDAVDILALFASVEPENNNLRSANHQFLELFHLYLSGTQAPPSARRDAIRKMAASGDPCIVRCAAIALESLLKTDSFSSSSSFDFGARPRSWGWEPKIYGEIWEWYNDGISLSLELSNRISDAKSILAGNIRSLWQIHACRDAIENAAYKLANEGSWIEGWLAVRSTLQYDGEKMSDDERARLSKLADLLKPTDLLHKARAVILNHQRVYDFSDGESDDDDAETSWEKASRFAQEIGRELALDPPVRGQFLGEVFRADHAPRAYACGLGLARGAPDLGEMWLDVSEAYKASGSEARSFRLPLLGGFLEQANERDPDFCGPLLDSLLTDEELSRHLPYLQVRVAIDERAIFRLRAAIHRNVTPANAFYAISNGLIESAPIEPLADLLIDLSSLSGGSEVALDILHMRFYCERKSETSPSPVLIGLGRTLLENSDFSTIHEHRDHAVEGVIEECLVGDGSEESSIKICRSVRSAIENNISFNRYPRTLEALFKSHPQVALDEILLPLPKWRRRGLAYDDFRKSVLESLDVHVLSDWADKDPNIRYPALGECLSLFTGDEAGNASIIFLDLLASAPDKPAFLGDFWRQLHPSSWSGSLADVLLKRREWLRPLEIHSDPTVRKWVTDNLPTLENWIAEEKVRDRAEEESFE